MKKYIVISIVVVLGAVIALITPGNRKNADRSGPGKGDVSLVSTRTSDRDMADPEREARRKRSIDLAAQKWYEELLEKYPRMKLVYRDVPDEQNGYLQFLKLAEKYGKPVLEMDGETMALPGDGGWDAAKFGAWLAEHQRYADEILRVAELPDRSTKGIALDRLLNGPSRMGSEFAMVLRASARLAFEKGDRDAALRYTTAAMNLGDHLSGIEAPTMLAKVVSTGIRDHACGLFQERFLPVLAGDPEALGRWKQVLFDDEKPAESYARTFVGEWNANVRSFLLPSLLGDHSVAGKSLPVDDVEGLIDTYTRTMQGTADGVLRSGPDRFDAAGASAAFPPAAVGVKETGEDEALSAEALLFPLKGMAEALGKNATRKAMHAAAVSILMGEEPPVDPVSGEAFVWDAGTRKLSRPGNVDDEESIILPAGN